MNFNGANCVRECGQNTAIKIEVNLVNYGPYLVQNMQRVFHCNFNVTEYHFCNVRSLPSKTTGLIRPFLNSDDVYILTDHL